MAGTRGNHVPMPDEATLKRWYLDEQIPYRVMVERWADASGVTVTTAGMAAKCSKYSWFVPRNQRHVGSPLTPWMDIRPDHQDMHDIQMLRKESARRQGKTTFTAHWVKRIDAYLRGLNEDDCVVEYRRNTKQGFWHVPRREGEEYVRLPAEWIAAQKVAQRATGRKKVS